jgi:uroporphyrinogen decarboxylase
MAETMTKRERVLAALAGEPTDRPPFGLWAHNYAKENSPEDLAEESIRLAQEFEFDFLKPQCRAQCFAEAWGGTWEPSGERTVSPTPVDQPIKQIADFAKLQPADPSGGPLGEQLEALRLIRAAVGDTPIIWTVFNPLMICRYLASGGEQMLLEGLRSDPKAIHHALDVVATTITAYSKAAVENGADGLFFATNLATEGLATPEQYQEFGPPYDRRVLDAVADAPFNLMHVCGDAIYLDLFEGYPVRAFNWALGRANPSLGQVEQRTGKAVVGGVSTKPRDLELSAADVKQEIEAATAEMRGRHLLIAPGCSSSPATADTIFGAARAAVFSLS